METIALIFLFLPCQGTFLAIGYPEISRIHENDDGLVIGNSQLLGSVQSPLATNASDNQEFQEYSSFPSLSLGTNVTVVGKVRGKRSPPRSLSKSPPKQTMSRSSTTNSKPLRAVSGIAKPSRISKPARSGAPMRSSQSKAPMKTTAGARRPKVATRPSPRTPSRTLTQGNRKVKAPGIGGRTQSQKTGLANRRVTTGTSKRTGIQKPRPGTKSTGLRSGLDKGISSRRSKAPSRVRKPGQAYEKQQLQRRRPKSALKSKNPISQRSRPGIRAGSQQRNLKMRKKIPVGRKSKSIKPSARRRGMTSSRRRLANFKTPRRSIRTAGQGLRSRRNPRSTALRQMRNRKSAVKNKQTARKAPKRRPSPTKKSFRGPNRRIQSASRTSRSGQTNRLASAKPRTARPRANTRGLTRGSKNLKKKPLLGARNKGTKAGLSRGKSLKNNFKKAPRKSVGRISPAKKNIAGTRRASLGPRGAQKGAKVGTTERNSRIGNKLVSSGAGRQGALQGKNNKFKRSLLPKSNKCAV